MSKVYAIISGKGGVGKTTTAINLGFAMNQFKEDVVIIDANLTTPNIGVHLGSPIVPISLNDVLSGKAKTHEAVYEHHSGTKIMPASLNSDPRLNTDRLIEVSKRLKRLTDIIIIDSPAGLAKEAISAIKACDEVIIVSNPDILSITDSLKTIKIAEDLKKPVTGVIITRVKRDGKDIPLKNIRTMLEKQILGIVPEDEAIRDALLMRDAVVQTNPKSESAQAYKKIAADLIGIRYVEEKDSFLDIILKKLKIRS